MVGEKVYLDNELRGQSSNEINISGLPKGMYLLNYYEDEKSPNKKTCNSCHQIEVQQRLNKPIWKEPVFIGIVGGTVFLVLIGLIYDYYKKKKQKDKES